jgi:hypothetical protein
VQDGPFVAADGGTRKEVWGPAGGRVSVAINVTATFTFLENTSPFGFFGRFLKLTIFGV